MANQGLNLATVVSVQFHALNFVEEAGIYNVSDVIQADSTHLTE